jgi:hypothetical protein
MSPKRRAPFLWETAMGEYFIPLDERKQAIGTQEAAIVLDLHWRHFAT